MTYQSTWAFFLLIPWFLLILWLWFRRQKQFPSLQYSHIESLKKVQPTLKVRLQKLPLIMNFAAGVFVIFALARPQTSDTLVRRNIEGIDIMIALDISDSMLIEDMKPLNRLESAKETIANFIKKRVSDRIGVVVFAGESFTLVPLTLDYDLILSRVAEIMTAQRARIKDGTAIGVALANAAGRLKDSVAKSRVVIFLTDGENNSGTIDPETGLSIAKGYGVKIYSIGIGKDGETRIPVYSKDMFGNTVKGYQPFESRVNEDLLGRMASETTGKFYRASREDSLSGVFSEIDRLEKTKIDVNKYTRYTELFPNYLRIGIFILVLSWLMQITWLRRYP